MSFIILRSDGLYYQGTSERKAKFGQTNPALYSEKKNAVERIEGLAKVCPDHSFEVVER